MAKQQIRCAIYTRKSSEEGLEQSFNSLEAQREACCAFTLSQKHEGWTVLSNRYDDGGFSGGTMERPALKQLLSDIKAARVDTVVVYKVDRLTRSLADFAKIIEIFDTHKVSFVSVTQQFNTTSSMGRLTLNVLLSFAQFEREITGERIRDKVAASKKKGIWLGGFVPLGYDCVERELVVNPAEATTVREIFRNYVRLGSVRKLQEFLDRRQIRSKARVSERFSGGASFSRGALYHLLSNPIYVGQIRHRSQCYPGRHQPIVSRKLWDRAASILKENDRAQRTERSRSSGSLLTGILFDSNGMRFTPTHAVKGAKRYRYYTSQTVIHDGGLKPEITRFPADEIEQLVKSRFLTLLQSPEKLTARTTQIVRGAVADAAIDLVRVWPSVQSSKQDQLVRTGLRRVILGQTAVSIEIDKTKLIRTLMAKNSDALASLEQLDLGIVTLTCQFHTLRRGREVRIESPQNDSRSDAAPIPSLVKAVTRGREWHDQIVAGKINSIDELAKQTGLRKRSVRRLLPFAWLSPKVVESILTGKHRRNLTVKDFLQGTPLCWQEQEERFLRIPTID